MAAHPSDPIALSLALSVIDSSDTPLVLLDEQFVVVAASASFCTAFGLPPGEVSGRLLFELGAGEWDVPQLRSLVSAALTTGARIGGYEMDLSRPDTGTRRLVINAHKLAYDEEPAETRLVLALSDVTEARANEQMNRELIQEKSVLLQELQHRVANSLQIIASVLLQSARRVNSAETRGHLTDAHGRVMSIATLQRQLAVSEVADVPLRAYFTQLSQSLGASMIHDRNQIAIEVDVDDSVADGDTSVSLGLIATELVINALKHAFPSGKNGKIIVSYHAHGPNWKLAISDNGIGMPQDASGGLGTSIVEALAKQLEAHIQVTDAKPGTTVSIVHAHLAAVAAPTTAAI